MKVEILKGCTSCGLCESINSDVFTIEENGAVVHNEKVRGNEEDCRKAAEGCPVNVIKIKE